MTSLCNRLPDFEEMEGEPSTAPTTPDGSMTFSPVLQPSQLVEAFDLDSGVEGSGTAHLIQNICFIGAGYVGGPSAAVLAYYNPDVRVTVVDKDAIRIQKWNSRHLPVYEPGLLEVVQSARDGYKRKKADSIGETENDLRKPNLFFSTEIAKTISSSDMVFLAVNTSTKTRGAGAGYATDMTALEGAVRAIAINARPGTIIVEKSTVPCRTSELIHEILETYRPGVNFHVLSNPEFLAEGTAIKDLSTPSRVLIGSRKTPCDILAAEALANIYMSWVSRSRIITTNIWSSELAKLVANAMLAQRISSINSISAICEQTGADVDEIAKSVGLDPRIGSKYLKAGIGFGGSCFQKDILSLVYLAESLGLDEVGQYWRQVVTMNNWQCSRFSQRVIRALNNTLMGKKITILGYAFKKDTGDTRDSLAPSIIKDLLAEEPHEIAIYDPLCKSELMKREISRALKEELNLFHPAGPIRIYEKPYEACTGSNAVLLLNNCEEFRFDSNVCHCQKQSSKTKVHSRLASRNTNCSREEDYLHESPIPCGQDCTDCKLDIKSDMGGYTEPLIWEMVTTSLQKPKLVFDGRGTFEDADVLEMQTKLGTKVVRIGKV